MVGKDLVLMNTTIANMNPIPKDRSLLCSIDRLVCGAKCA